MRCITCEKWAPLNAGPEYATDHAAVPLQDHGWSEYRWGRAMGVLFCSDACAREFISSEVPK